MVTPITPAAVPRWTGFGAWASPECPITWLRGDIQQTNNQPVNQYWIDVLITDNGNAEIKLLWVQIWIISWIKVFPASPPLPN